MKSTPVPCSSVLCLVALFFFIATELSVSPAQEPSQHSASQGKESTSKTLQPHERFKDMALFGPLCHGDTLNLNYLLEELNIVGYQRTELQRIAAMTRKESDALAIEFHREQVKRGEQFSYFDDPYWMGKFLDNQSRFVAGLEDVLLPKQMKELRHVMAQRGALKSRSLEPFILPFQPLDLLELN